MAKFETKKSLGQHFLNSAAVPRLMTEAGQVKEGDLVVEIGPGTGALTKELLGAGAEVLALEADPRAIEVLNDTFKDELASGQLRVTHLDARELDLKSLGLKDHSFKVIANIPYYLTGQLFRAFLAGEVQPKSLVFLVQKEVGKRASVQLNRDEKESLLSLSIKAFGEPKYVKTIGKGHFTPPPKVDSAIVLVANINRDRFKDLSPEHFFEVLHLGFGSKRKQLLGNLSQAYPRDFVAKTLVSLGLNADIRAEDISIDDWIEIAKALKESIKSG